MPAGYAAFPAAPPVGAPSILSRAILNVYSKGDCDGCVPRRAACPAMGQSVMWYRVCLPSLTLCSSSPLWEHCTEIFEAPQEGILLRQRGRAPHFSHEGWLGIREMCRGRANTVHKREKIVLQCQTCLGFESDQLSKVPSVGRARRPGRATVLASRSTNAGRLAFVVRREKVQGEERP